MPYTFSMEEYVDATPERLFEVVTNLDEATNWMNGFVRIDKAGDRSFGVGTEFDETRKMFGKDSTEHFEVTEYEPPSKVSFYVDGSKGTSKKGEFYFTYEITEAGSGSRITLFSKIDMPGRFAPLLFRIFGGFFKRAMRKDLRSMKSYAERKTA